jgi:hypothetical protein
VARAIANLAVVASIPWKDFFDRTSLVETGLADDPALIYPRMDFETRDRYRKAVEELAFGAGKSELEVAERVVAQARMRKAASPSDHVGHWLIGDGRRELESLLGFREHAAFGRWLLHHAGALYAGGLLAASLGALVLPAAYIVMAGAGPVAWTLAMGLALLPASVLGVTAVHWFVTLVVPPRVLAKLDFEKGIPPDCATAVVVPVIIRDADEVPRFIERLQQHPTPRCASFCSATWPMRPTNDWRETKKRNGRFRGVFARLTRATRKQAPAHSTCSTARAATIPARIAGWGGSASAASSKSSTGSYSAKVLRVSPGKWATGMRCARRASS